MAALKRVGDLEINENNEYQESFWRIERYAWVVMLVIIILAVLGFMGPGIFSKRAVSNDQIRVEYAQFARYKASSVLELELEKISGGEAVFWIDRRYLAEAIQLGGITPMPDKVQFDSERVIFTIPASPGRPVVVEIELQPQKIGIIEGRVGLLNDKSVKFNQFIYP